MCSLCVFILDRRARFVNTGSGGSVGTDVVLSGSLRLFNGIVFAFVDWGPLDDNLSSDFFRFFERLRAFSRDVFATSDVSAAKFPEILGELDPGCPSQCQDIRLAAIWGHWSMALCQT